MTKDTFYFSHDSNARNDVKIIKLRRVLGIEGYGIYFAIIEILREQKDHKLPLSSVSDIAFDLRVSDEKVQSVICGFDLFDIEDEEFFSARLLRSMNVWYNKKKALSEAGKRGNDKRWSNRSETKELSGGDSGGDKVAIAIKVNKSKEDKSNTSNTSRVDTRVSSEKYSFEDKLKYFMKLFNETKGTPQKPAQYKAIDKVKSAFRNRLKDGYKSSDFKRAIENCKKDPHHIESKLKYLTPEFILRSDKLEMYLNFSAQKQISLDIPMSNSEKRKLGLMEQL